MIEKLAEHIRNKYKYVSFTSDEELESDAESSDTTESTESKPEND